MAGITSKAYRKKISRAYELPLLRAILLFQFASMLLLAFRDGAVEAFSLTMSVVLPLGTFLGLKVIVKIWPVDRCIYMLSAFLCSLGVVLLRAVFKKETNAYEQAFFIGIGYVCMLMAAGFIRRGTPSRTLVHWVMVLSVGFMLLPFVFGTSSAANNWVRIGSIQFQPSEMMKPVLILVLAHGFSDKRGWRVWMIYIVYSVILCCILFVQPDLGSVFLFFLITVCMFFLGTGKKKFTLFVLLFAAAGVFVFLKVLEASDAFQYLSYRIAIWKDPWSGQYEDSRQIVQGLISIASGAWMGSGLGLGSAERVAVVASDYIFAALSEEFGIFFAMCVLMIYLLLMLRGTLVAMNARLRFHALTAFGCVFALTVQMLLIVAGNLHILPLTGVTLPFVSAGGSSMISSMAMIGLVLGVSGVNAQDEYDDLVRLNGGEWREEE